MILGDLDPTQGTHREFRTKNLDNTRLSSTVWFKSRLDF